ncbi:hypothetical protein AFLA_009442 [Aspergillus flavus NRRL3357]|nr:hypothetical protein AFLA_009442 [Aspergillus flavus NRRL3357]
MINPAKLTTSHWIYFLSEHKYNSNVKIYFEGYIHMTTNVDRTYHPTYQIRFLCSRTLRSDCRPVPDIYSQR